MAKNTTNVLIILDYLLRYTDKDHMSSAKDINEYAVKEYGVTIDRRSIKDFLEELEVLNNDYRDNFGFTIKKSDGERPKYYVEDRAFKEGELFAICNSIKDSQYTTPELTNYLLKLVLKNSVSEYRLNKIYDSLVSSGSKVEKLSHDLAKKIKLVETAIKEKRMITYSFKYDTTGKVSTNYFYKIMYINGKANAVIIRNNKLDTCQLDLLNIINVEHSIFTEGDRHKFRINEMIDGENTPEEELKTSKLPNPKIPTANCKFTFDNTPYSIDMVCKSYKNFFREELVYTIKNGVCYTETTCQEDLFIQWCTSYEVAYLIKVIGSENLIVKLSMHYQILIKQNDLDKWCITPVNNIKKPNK